MKIFTFQEVCQRWRYLKDELHLKIKNQDLVPAVVYTLPDIPDFEIKHLSNGEVIRRSPRIEIGIPNTDLDLTYLHDVVSTGVAPIDYRLTYAALQPSLNKARWSIGTKEYRLIGNLPEAIACDGKNAQNNFVFPQEVLEKAEDILEIEPRDVNKVRETSLRLFISSCLSSFSKHNNGNLPKSEEELIRFALQNTIQGYVEIKDSGGKYQWRKITFDGESSNWRSFTRAYEEVLVDQQFE